MPDAYPPEKRRWVMGRVRSRNTSAELAVRSIIHGMGFRFRLHRSDLPGTPDIVLPRHKKVVLVHGCFWHGHQGCPRAAEPKSNVEFWRAKLAANAERDAASIRALEELGWRVLVVWTCELRKPEELWSRLHDFLEG